MPELIDAEAPSPWRVRVQLDGPGGSPFEDATQWRLVSDVGALPVARAWLEDAAVVALALAQPLAPEQEYFVTHTSATATARVSFQRAPAAQVDLEAPGDPEAEALGLDVDWFGELDPSGDARTERGEACLRHDLAARALTRPGELVHQPTAGAATIEQNAPSGAARASLYQAALRREALDDDRVEDAAVAVTVTTKGVVRATIRARSRALGRDVSTAVEPT